MGYHVKAYGQKSYNGAAILARHTIEDVTCGIPGFADPSARYIEAVVGGRIRVASLYAPNGNPTGTDKFRYKIEWMEKLRAHLRSLLKNDEAIVAGGDFNVVRRDDMIYNAQAFKDDAIMRPESREEMEKLLALGLEDAWTAMHGAEIGYTYWDYRAGAFAKNHGITLDYFLLNSQARKILKGASVDKSPRGREHASDHAPLWIEIG
jgi:exodeoxyribonuclease-3